VAQEQDAEMDAAAPTPPPWFDAHGLTAGEWRSWAEGLGLPGFRGEQAFQGFMKDAAGFSGIAGLPRELAARLDGALQVHLPGEARRQESSDGTVKSLLALHDGRLVECVSIPTADRHTVCVSSQVGCAVGCSFCASGQNGLERDLAAGEIVAQVLHHHRRRPVTNVVFMGSGEPLFNYAQVLQAIRVLGDAKGLGMGRRRFTVSTSGVPARIRQLAADEPQVTLALSLHAPDDETRSRLVPLNRRWPIAELMEAMTDYSRQVSRRITLEYVALADANLAPAQAEALAALARTFAAHINLIPFNPVTATPHRAPTSAELDAFVAAVRAHGGHLTVRGNRGRDIDAACGQLRRRALEASQGPAQPA
jgi:23S rRNA (adenine2503-C2)-methyltransferase